jgi:hypothetical protein
MHHDPLRSTQKRPFFAFGHNRLTGTCDKLALGPRGRRWPA